MNFRFWKTTFYISSSVSSSHSFWKQAYLNPSFPLSHCLNIPLTIWFLSLSNLVDLNFSSIKGILHLWCSYRIKFQVNVSIYRVNILLKNLFQVVLPLKDFNIQLFSSECFQWNNSKRIGIGQYQRTKHAKSKNQRSGRNSSIKGQKLRDEHQNVT